MQLRLSSTRREDFASGQRLAVVRGPAPEPDAASGLFPGPHLIADAQPLPGVGAVLTRPDQAGTLRVLGTFRLPDARPGLPSRVGRWVEVLEAFQVEPGRQSWAASKCGHSLAWITLSDKGYAGLREDRAGPLIVEVLDKQSGGPLELAWAQGFLLPDEPERLRSLLSELALEQGFDLIVTTGGTGVGPRDTTPETTLTVIEKRLPGMEAAMLRASLRKTPHAMISRAVVGTLGRALIINLPGSPKAVRENLEALLPALDHALAKLQGDPSDCAAAHPLDVSPTITQ